MTTTAARALRGCTARDVMRNQMVTVVPEMTVRELAHTLLEAGVRSVPVLGPAGKLLGVASQADVTRMALLGLRSVDGGTAESDGGLDAVRVRDVMGPVGPTVLPDEPLPALVRRFVRDRAQRVLIVENDILLGIVTPVDVLSAIDQAPLPTAAVA